MMICLAYSLIIDENNEYNGKFPDSMALFYVKIPCCFALHFSIQPQIQKGLTIMKFSNN